MRNIKNDLTNQRFGKLLVINRTDRKDITGSWYWKCICDCGKETYAISNSLKKGTKKSCGCFQREVAGNHRKLKLKGKRFGRLLVLNETEQRKKSDGKIIWKCICDCGNEVFADGTSLVTKFIVSCGCKQKDNGISFSRKNNSENVVENTKLDLLTAKTSRRNTTGVRGVSFNKSTNRYLAYINFQRKHIHLGSFQTLEEASKARTRAEEEYFHPILEKYNKPTNK